MGPGDLAPNHVLTEGKERLYIVDFPHGFSFAPPQENGLVGCGFLIIVHAVDGVTTGHPHTS